MFPGILNQHSIRYEWRVAVYAKSRHEAMNWRNSVVSLTVPMLSVRSLTEHRVAESARDRKINCIESINCAGKARRNSPPSTERCRLLANAVLSYTRKKTSNQSSNIAKHQWRHVHSEHDIVCFLAHGMSIHQTSHLRRFQFCCESHQKEQCSKCPRHHLGK